MFSTNKNKKFCKACNTPLKKQKSTYCNNECQIKFRRENGMYPVKVSTEEKFRKKAESGIYFIEISTKKELFSRHKTYQSARNTICKHARKVYQNSGKPRQCLICGYNRHTDVAHIRSVSDFPDTAFIGEINDINNLMALCPNHHWEFDNDLLEIDYPYEQDISE